MIGFTWAYFPGFSIKALGLNFLKSSDLLNQAHIKIENNKRNLLSNHLGIIETGYIRCETKPNFKELSAVGSKTR